MRIETDQKLFLGLKLGSEMRREYAEGKLAHRPAFKPGDPARLELVEVKGDLFIGRILDPGLALDEVGDLERNIKSIVAVTFSVSKPAGPLRIFPVEREDVNAGLAAAANS
jgi:hypothetical protein